MRDTFWMEDEVRLGWEESDLENGDLFQKLDNLEMSNTLSFLESHIKESIFQQTQYPITDTGSQLLDPVWRQNLAVNNSQSNRIPTLRNTGKFHPQPTKSTSLPRSFATRLASSGYFAS